MSQTAPPSIGFPDDELLFNDLNRQSNVSTTFDLDNEPTTNQEVATNPSFLPASTKIRRAVLQAVQDVQWANDVQQSYRELKRNQRKVIRSKLLMGTSLGLEMSERCVLCTLPLGTCEHYKPVYQHHHHGTSGPQRSIMKRQYQPPQKQQHSSSHNKTAASKGSGLFSSSTDGFDHDFLADMGHGPQGFGPPIQPDITHRAGLQQSHPHPDLVDPTGGGLDGFFTQSLATSQSSGSMGGAYERDQGSDGELLVLLDVFHTDNHLPHHNTHGTSASPGLRSSQRANGYDDPLGAPFPSHEGYDGKEVFTSVTAVGDDRPSSSSRGMGEEKGIEGVGGTTSVGGVDMKGLRWITLDARYSDQLGADEAQVSAPSDRGWHTTTLLQGGGNQQAHVDTSSSTDHGPEKRRGKDKGQGKRGGDNGMWWLNKCDGNVIVIFGGLRYKHNAVPEPFSSSDLYSRLNTFVGVGSVEVGVSDQDCLSDTYVYDTDNKAWYCSKATYKPAGRYGHVAAALDAHRMVVFGGRGEHGRHFGDTWVYDYRYDKWEAVEMRPSRELGRLSAPCPRVFAACVAVNHHQAYSSFRATEKLPNEKNDNNNHDDDLGYGRPTPQYLKVSDVSLFQTVYLTGGTDGTENFGDLWLLKGCHVTVRRVEVRDEAAEKEQREHEEAQAARQARRAQRQRRRQRQRQREAIERGEGGDPWIPPSPQAQSQKHGQGPGYSSTDEDDEDDDDEEDGGGTLVMYWEKGFTLGAPPAPRYGHRMVLLNQTNVAANARLHRQGQGLGLEGSNESDALLAELMLPCEVEVKIAVVGGCAVAPVSEIGRGGAATGYVPPHGISSGAAVEAACGGLTDTVADLFGITTATPSNNTHSQGQRPLSLPSEEEVDLALDSLLNRFGTRDDELAVLANALSAHYANEGTEGKLRAQWFLQRVADFDIANAAHEAAEETAASGDRATRLRQLYRDAALIPYRLSTLEQETRQAEQALVQAWQMKNAQRSLNTQRAKHPYPLLDVHFLALSVPAAHPYAASTAMIMEPLAMAGRGAGGGKSGGGLLQTLFPNATITPANLRHLDPHATATEEALARKQWKRRKKEERRQRLEQEELRRQELGEGLAQGSMSLATVGGLSYDSSMLETNALASAHTGTQLDVNNPNCGFIDAETVQFIDTLAFPEGGQGLVRVQGVPQTTPIFSSQMAQPEVQGPEQGPGPTLAGTVPVSHGQLNHSSPPSPTAITAAAAPSSSSSSSAAAWTAFTAASMMELLSAPAIGLHWRAQEYPFVRGAGGKGSIPSARMHLGACCIEDYLIVVGGTVPSCLTHTPVDAMVPPAGSASGPSSRVYVLDMKTMVWSQLAPTTSQEYYEYPLKIAAADVIRAQKRVRSEQATALSLGAVHGRTVDLAQAEAVLSVCQWRLRSLLRESQEANSAPSPRWGCTFLAQGQRALLFGGWTARCVVGMGGGRGEANRGDRSLRPVDEGIPVLDVEEMHERRRRQEEEFAATLERERSKVELKARFQEIRFAFELRREILAELAREAEERRLMAMEEIRSAVPPLLVPPPVRLVKANEHTMWVEWDRLKFDADDARVADPKTSVTYYLYAKIGYQSLLVGDRVNVLAMVRTKEEVANEITPLNTDRRRGLKQLAKYLYVHTPVWREKRQRLCTRKDRDPLTGAARNDKHFELYPGEITRASGDGWFDVAFDDSTFEASIPRCRIFRIPSPAVDTYGNVVEEKEPYTFTRRFRLAKQRKIKEKRRRTLLKMNPQFDELPSQAMSPGQRLGLGLAGGGMPHAYATAVRRGGGLTAAAFTTDGLKGHIQEEAGRRSRPTSRPVSRAPSPRPQPAEEGEGEGRWEEEVEEEEEWGSDNDAYDDSDDDDDENDEDFGSEVGAGMGGGTLVTQVSVDDSQALYWHGPTHPLTHIKNERKRGRAGRTIDIQRVTAKVPRGVGWTLVYMGNNVNYALEGLVPDDVLVAETGIVVPVVFSLQVHGLDYPFYEFSQMAPKSVFFTRNAANRRPAPPAPTAPSIAEGTLSSSSSSAKELSHNRGKTGGMVLTMSPPPMKVKGQGQGQGQALGQGPGLDYGVGAHGDSVTSALTHATGIGSNHNNITNVSGVVSTSPTKGAGIKNKVLAGLMQQRTEQGQGQGLGPASATTDAGSSQAQEPAPVQIVIKKKSKLQELLHPTPAPAPVSATSRADKQVADTTGALLSEDEEAGDASASPSHSPSKGQSHNQSSTASRSNSPSKSPSKSRSTSPSKAPGTASEAASVSSNPMARLAAAANTITLMDNEVLAKQSAATLLKDMLGSSLVATKRQMQNKAKAIALEELRLAAAQQALEAAEDEERRKPKFKQRSITSTSSSQALTQYAHAPPNEEDKAALLDYGMTLKLAGGDVDPGAALSNPVDPKPFVSKTKRHLISAIVEGNRCVQMERRGDATEATGSFDHFV